MSDSVKVHISEGPIGLREDVVKLIRHHLQLSVEVQSTHSFGNEDFIYIRKRQRADKTPPLGWRRAYYPKYQVLTPVLYRWVYHRDSNSHSIDAVWGDGSRTLHNLNRWHNKVWPQCGESFRPFTDRRRYRDKPSIPFYPAQFSSLEALV